MQDVKRNVHPHQTTSGRSMSTDHFDLLKSMQARMACMSGPARSGFHNEEQSEGVDIAVHAAPHSFCPIGAAKKPQNSATAAMKTSDNHSGDRTQRPQKGFPSGASEMSSLSSLHEQLPDRMDDFDATLELSRRPAPANPQKEAPQEETRKPEAPSSAAPSAALEAVLQPSRAAAVPGVGWSAKAPSHPGAAKPKLSAKQAEHIRIWSFRDGKVSARHQKPRAAASKGKVLSQNPPGAANASSKKQQPVQRSQQLPQKAPQQAAHKAQPKQPPRAQLHAAASAPSASSAQQCVQQLEIPALQLQTAAATALRVTVPPRDYVAQQDQDIPARTPVTSSHQPSNMEQQEGTTDGSLGLEAGKLLSQIARMTERDAAAGGLDHPTLLACDEVLPETDLPLRPVPRLKLAKDRALPQPGLLETAPSVAQKFQDRLTAVISSSARRSASSSAFVPSAPAPDGSAFPAAALGAGPRAPGRSSLQPPRGLSAWEAALEAFCAELSDDDNEKEEGFQARRPNGARPRNGAVCHTTRVVQRRAAGRQLRRQASSAKRGATHLSTSRRRARAATPKGFYEEPDLHTGSDTETDVAPASLPQQPRRRRAKKWHAGRAAEAPVERILPCSRAATFEEVQHWKRGRPQQKKPAAAHRADASLSPSRHGLWPVFWLVPQMPSYAVAGTPADDFSTG